MINYTPDTTSVHDELRKRGIRFRTSIRFWQERVNRRIKTDDWPVSACGDSILMLTICEDAHDQTIAKWLNINEHEIKLERAKAVEILLDEYRTVLDERVKDDSDVLFPIQRSLDQKSALLQAYTLSRGRDENLGNMLEGYLRQGYIVYLAVAYINLRFDMYAKTSPNYKPVKELFKLTDYSEYHLRDLISGGLIEGEQTESGWYGSYESAIEYQEQQRGSKGGSPRRPRRIR